MSLWFSKNLGDAMLAGEALEHVKTLFLSEHDQANRSEDMAVFIRHESEGRLHCEVMLYFSPATASVAQALDATPCRKPGSESLGLLAGSQAAWAACFPEIAKP